MELLGIPQPPLSFPEVDPSDSSHSSHPSDLVPDAPSRFNLPAKPRALEIRGEDLNLFADLPLFELA